MINQAHVSIHIASFEFNLTSVAEALIAAKIRSVDVKWVTEIAALYLQEFEKFWN